MHIQLIDTNFEFKKVHPRIVFTEFHNKIHPYGSLTCSYNPHKTENVELKGNSDIPNISFVIHTNNYRNDCHYGKVPHNLKDGANAIIRVGDEYQDFSRENEFQLIITDLSIDGIRKIMNEKSKIVPTLTNYEVYDRLQKIKQLYNSGNFTCKAISKNDSGYIADLLKLDDKIFLDNINLLTTRNLKIIHDLLFRNYDVDLFSPLLSKSLVNEIDINIEKVHKVTETLNYMKFASTSMEKFKSTVSGQLNDINKMQEQMKALNEKNDSSNEKLKLTELDLALEKDESAKLKEKIKDLNSSLEDFRKKYYFEEKNRIAIEKELETLKEEHQNLQKQMTTVQSNPTEFATSIRNTTCNDCIENIQDRVKAESKLQTLILSHKIHS